MNIPTLDLRAGDPMPEPASLALDPEVTARVREILDRVRDAGDAALIEFTQRFDGADVAGRIRVSDDEIDAAAEAIEPDLQRAIEATAERLTDLHGRQLPADWEADNWGVRYGERVKPIAAVGCYVPGGRASYPSTVLMTAVPAKVAGVPRVVLCTPPDERGAVPVPVLFAARVAGVDEIYRVGGAHAVGALAFGTASIAKVDKIVGPGNLWVTAAKKEVFGAVGIDSLAGPTELVVIADAGADPAMLAVDLVAQAEHDPVARTVLVSTDDGLVEATRLALIDEVSASPRREIVESAMDHMVFVLAGDLREAAAVSDRLAPEHLQIVTADPHEVLGSVRSYGAAFLGPRTPVSFGDYGVGSNHVLPTMANARFTSGLRAADFVTVSSWVEAGAGSNDAVGPGVETIATAEGLAAHARASRIRRG